MSDTEMTPPLGAMSIQREIMIHAPRPRVFNALINQTGAWWVEPYRLAKGTHTIVLEPRVGGRLYEDWGGGQGGLWGIVTSIKKDEWVELTGAIGMSDIAHGWVRIELTDSSGGTHVRLYHRAFGQLTPKTESNYAGGWEFLLGKLRDHAEKK